MKKIFKTLALLGLTLCLTACGSTKTPTEESGNYLRVGVRTNLSNFSTYNEEADTYYGFEDDVAKEVALSLGYDGVSYIGLSAEDRDSALKNGTVDCLIAAYSRTDERAETFDLSEPYYYDKGKVMVEKSSLFYDYSDLQGQVVAVRNNTDAAENVIKKLNDLGLIREATANAASLFMTIIEMDSYDDMIDALEEGKVDAVCADGCITLSHLDDCRRYFEEAYSTEEYVIATQKGSELSEKVDACVKAMNEDGALTGLLEKWGV